MSAIEPAPHELPVILMGEMSFRSLAERRQDRPLIARPHEGGFVLQTRLTGNEWIQLANAHNAPRMFASLNTLALLLQKWGHDGFLVDVRGYAPGPVRQPRPERSKAMKQGRLPGKKTSRPPARKAAAK